jgi:hypothetical protein
MQPRISPPVTSQPAVAKPELDQIIPSASIAELDAQIDAQEQIAAASAEDERDIMGEFEETFPVAPSQPRQQASTMTTSQAIAANNAAELARKMEQVEMFEEKVEAKKEEAVAKAKDPRSESLARAQQIARSLGVTNLSDDEYDIPTFIRRQQQNTTLNN